MRHRKCTKYTPQVDQPCGPHQLVVLQLVSPPNFVISSSCSFDFSSISPPSGASLVSDSSPTAIVLPANREVRRRAVKKNCLFYETVSLSTQMHFVVGPNVQDENVFWSWTKLYHNFRINHTYDDHDGHLELRLHRSLITVLWIESHVTSTEVFNPTFTVVDQLERPVRYLEPILFGPLLRANRVFRRRADRDLRAHWSHLQLLHLHRASTATTSSTASTPPLFVPTS